LQSRAPPRTLPWSLELDLTSCSAVTGKVIKEGEGEDKGKSNIT